jgi:hypothetical protein
MPSRAYLYSKSAYKVKLYDQITVEPEAPRIVGTFVGETVGQRFRDQDLLGFRGKESELVYRGRDLRESGFEWRARERTPYFSK